MISPLQSESTPGERAEPPCPHFGTCTGCQLQHLTYTAQLTRKSAYLRNLLGESAPPINVHASPPLGYRNRIRLTLANVAGQLRAGYLRSPAKAASGDEAGEYATGKGPDEPLEPTAIEKASFLPITQCPIAAPILWRAAEAFLAIAPKSKLLQDTRWIPDQLELFALPDETRINFTLYLRTSLRELPKPAQAAFGHLCEALRAQLPELIGAGIALLPRASSSRSRRSESPRPAASWGQQGINYPVPLADGDTIAYWVPRTAFFQVNRFLVPELVQTVLAVAQDAPNRGLAWDLYAGAGLFARPLARHFEAVTAVEIAEPAATALAQTGIRNLRAVKATTQEFLRRAVLQRERPEVVLLDPPRTGAGADICKALARIASPVLIYVSCSPLHLAQDLRVLAEAGYELSALHLFDLFPQTTHIETVAVLRLQR